MEKYVSHYSAAYFWNTPYIDAVIGSTANKRQGDDYAFLRRRTLSYKKDQITHLCQLTLPVGAVVSKNGIMVASPELVFLQLAGKLDIHRLILLGLQLCSHSPGKPSAALTTKKKLKAFLGKTEGHRGQRKALRAVKYIEEGSASIMESLAFMVLTLPHALGGYGLDGAVFNQEILIEGAAARRLGKKHCFADLYYKSAKLAVEYESFAFHNSPSEQGNDVMRSAVLERQGIEIKGFTTIQLYDKDACRDFALNLASRLGKRIQIRTKKFDQMHTNLRELLPTGKPGNESDGE